MKLITAFHNNLPNNKKTQRIDGILEAFVGTLIEDSHLSELRAYVEDLVRRENAKHPRTTPLHVTSLRDGHISIRLDNSDKCMWFAVAEVKRRWEDLREFDTTNM